MGALPALTGSFGVDMGTLRADTDPISTGGGTTDWSDWSGYLCTTPTGGKYADHECGGGVNHSACSWLVSSDNV